VLTDDSKGNIAAKYLSRYVALLPFAVEGGVVVKAELVKYRYLPTTAEGTSQRNISAGMSPFFLLL
jgi:hypothetical protein